MQYVRMFCATLTLLSACTNGIHRRSEIYSDIWADYDSMLSNKCQYCIFIFNIESESTSKQIRWRSNENEMHMPDRDSEEL